MFRFLFKRTFCSSTIKSGIFHKSVKKENIIETSELINQLKDAKTRILNCSFYFPSERKNALAEHVNSRIPGSVYFDIAHASHKGKANPYMLPKEQKFNEYIEKLRLHKDDNIICYDNKGNTSSSRVWWMLKELYGFPNVHVLNGGFPLWTKQNLPIENGECASFFKNANPPKSLLKPNPHKIALFQGIRIIEVVKRRGIVNDQIIDVRPAEIFDGIHDDILKPKRKGTIRHAINVPTNLLIDKNTKKFKSAKELYFLFTDEYRVNLSRPIICYCNTGISACSALLAFAEAGAESTLLYDGGWLEYVFFTQKQK